MGDVIMFRTTPFILCKSSAPFAGRADPARRPSAKIAFFPGIRYLADSQDAEKKCFDLASKKPKPTEKK